MKKNVAAVNKQHQDNIFYYKTKIPCAGDM